MASRRTMLGLAGAATVAAGITVASSGIADADTNVPDGLKPGGEVDRYVKKLAAKGEFSGSFLLTRNRRKVLARSYGMADFAAEVPNEKGTRFKLASVSKMFTSVAIQHLAQQGKLRYGKPIGAYIDGFDAEIADKVTIHHLLLHTSGLGDFFDLPGWQEAAREWDTADEVFDGTLDFIREVTPAFPAGSDFAYSNAGYCVLGGIIAAVSNQSYYDYVRQHVFASAGMADSDFFTKPEWENDPSIAHPHVKDEETGEWADIIDQYPFIGLPAGDSFANCADMNRFAHALLDNNLLSPPYTSIMLGAKAPATGGRKPPQNKKNPKPPKELFLGYGTYSNLVGDQWVHGFAGGGPGGGCSTSIDIYPDSGWVTVFLTNHDAELREVTQLVQGHIIGDA